MNGKNGRAISALGFIIMCFAIVPAVAEYIPPGGSGGGSITLGGSPATVYSITAPDDISSWALSPSDGENTHVGTLHMSANGEWKITANDADLLNTLGHMTEWDGSGYNVLNKLAAAMHVSVESGENVSAGYEVVLPAGGMIAYGASTGSAEKDVAVTFKQWALYSDKVLPNNHNYRIVITFTIAPSYL